MLSWVLLVCTAFATPKYLTIEKIPSISAKPGASLTVAIPISVEKEYHVHSNPAASKQYIATELKLEPAEKIKIGQPQYPRGKSYRMQSSPTEISIYDGRFQIRVPVMMATDFKKGSSELKGTLHFQACNDKICFFPQTIPVVIPVSVQ